MSSSHRTILYNITMHRRISSEPETYKDFGSIEYACKGKTVDILMLFINDVAERGKGYGYGLIILSLCNIIIRPLSTIALLSFRRHRKAALIA